MWHSSWRAEDPGRCLHRSVAWADVCMESPVGESLEEMSREAGAPQDRCTDPDGRDEQRGTKWRETDRI